MPKPRLIQTGDKFNRFTVVEEVEPVVTPHNKSRRFLCRCSCGVEIVVQMGNLTSGASMSCGCLRREFNIKRSTKHGHSPEAGRTSEYSIWNAMRQRCHNANHSRYKDYGGRGVKVCDRWRLSFANFLADMGEKPSPKHTIDRFPNKDGDYEPGNCRWATSKEQCNNKRNNRLVTFLGKTQNITQWSEETGISYDTLRLRLVSYKWPVERALTEPVMSLQQRKRICREKLESDRAQKTHQQPS